MGSLPGRDLNRWYATPEQQIILCFCILAYDYLKEKYKVVKEQEHYKLMNHWISDLVDYIPPEHRTNLPNRLKNRGDKPNRKGYENEHPTHPTKQNSTGRFWEWAKARCADAVRCEYTLTKEEMAIAVQTYAGVKEPAFTIVEYKSEVLPEKPRPTLPSEIKPPEFINLNEMFDIIEELVDRVDELSSRVDLIMKNLTRA